MLESKWIWRTLGPPATILAFMWVSGALVPARHALAKSERLRASPEAVWEAITRVEDVPRWRPSIRKVEVLYRDPTMIWREVDAQGAISRWEELEGSPATRWKLRYARETGDAEGTWTFDLVPLEDGGTRLALAEDGTLDGAFARFKARYFIGFGYALESYLADLRKRLVEPVP